MQSEVAGGVKATRQRIAPIRFLHPVGRSTLRQGITVPVESQVSRLAQIRKGEKVTIEIRFGQGQCVHAYLRRINNAVGHLQFRYETRQESELRDYLVETFGEKPKNAILEIMEAQPRVFLFSPVSIAHTPSKLCLYKPHFHNLDESDTRVVREFHELDRCLASIGYDAEHSQSDYNKQITDFLVAAGWGSEVRILEKIGLRCDLEKRRVA